MVSNNAHKFGEEEGGGLAVSGYPLQSWEEEGIYR